MLKVAVFLDYANINSASSSSFCKINYEALLKYLADYDEGRNLKVAYAYVPIDPRKEHAMNDEITLLWESGYIVRSKVGVIAGNTYKCNFDIEMTLDIMKTSFEISPDIIVIVSGDSDFVPVVTELREKGIRVEVASFNRSMSQLLSNRCSGSICLDELIEESIEDVDYCLANDTQNGVAREYEN